MDKIARIYWKEIQIIYNKMVCICNTLRSRQQKI